MDTSYQLRSRGIEVDLIAWYPFRVSVEDERQPQRWGIGSRGIFYIGGQTPVRLQYSLTDINMLFSTEVESTGLGEYGPNAKPGQNWRAYHPKRMELRDHLKRPLQFSTNAMQLAEQNAVADAVYCPYPRLKQTKRIG